MLRRSTLLSAVLAAGLAAAAPASAAPHGGPLAHAAGGDVPPPLPSLVQTRITRTENALDRLTNYVDDGDTVGVTRTGKVIRRQLAAAWRGAVYYIQNPPPPIGGDARVRAGSLKPKLRAHASGGAVVGAVADQYQTAGGVFQAYHETAATIAELTDGARVPVLNEMSKTLFWTLDARDKAVAAAHAFEPVADPLAVDSFAIEMPTVTPTLDDETQQIRGLQSGAKDLRPGGTKILRDALVQTILTENTINTFWPPLADG
jgi:hypothetical protein